MNAAKPSDGLLGAARTLELIRFVYGSRDQRTIVQLTHDFGVMTSTPRNRISNTLSMLTRLNLLEAFEDEIKWPTGTPTTEEGWRKKIKVATAVEITQRILDQQISSCIRLVEPPNKLTIDSWCAPGTDDGLHLWIREFGVANRTENSTRIWRVCDSLADKFLDGVRSSNERHELKKYSQKQLEAQLENQKKVGEEAEKWVFQYERKRLQQHPLLDQIEHVAPTYASAGFDIISYSTELSLNHDWFIEVKSFSGHPNFYWSENEIEKAKKLGEEYVLYLVDRSKMNEDGYRPKIIRGPYAALIETTDSGWAQKPVSFHFFQSV